MRRDDLLLADAGLAIGLPGREQALRLRVDFLARAAFGIALVFIKAVAVLLAKAPVAQENFERRLERHVHARRESRRDDLDDMVRNIHADDVDEIGRSHRPAKGFHRLVDLLKTGAVVNEAQKRDEIRRERAVDDKPRAILDHDRRLAHRGRIAGDRRDGLGGRFGAANHFDQRHFWYGVEKMHAQKIFRAPQTLRQACRSARRMYSRQGLRWG